MHLADAFIQSDLHCAFKLYIFYQYELFKLFKLIVTFFFQNTMYLIQIVIYILILHDVFILFYEQN